MAEFALLCPTQDELDLPPYLVRLLVQLEEIVGAAQPRPPEAAPAVPSPRDARSRPAPLIRG